MTSADGAVGECCSDPGVIGAHRCAVYRPIRPDGTTQSDATARLTRRHPGERLDEQRGLAVSEPKCQGTTAQAVARPVGEFGSGVHAGRIHEAAYRLELDGVGAQLFVARGIERRAGDAGEQLGRVAQSGRRFLHADTVAPATDIRITPVQVRY